MTLANLIMLGLGIFALIAGLALLALSARGSEGARAARRLVGAMLAALGICLTLFALGLAGKLEPSHA